MNKKLKQAIRLCLPRSLGPKRILGGALKGKIIVTSWHDYPAAILGRTERPLIEWLHQNVRPGETWLDVGAHYGYTAIAMSKLVGPQGRVFAFEPMTASAGCIARTRSLNGFSQLTVVPFALSDCEAINAAKLPTTRGMVDSTLQQPTQFEPFMLAGLDWLWSRIGTENGQPLQIHGVKIDVQGMEIHALKGMAQTLRQYHPKLVVELHNGVSRREFLDLLTSLGYSGHGLPVDRVSSSSSQYADDTSYAFQPA